MHRHLRLAAPGDSTTVGIGDPVPGGGWRGWARAEQVNLVVDEVHRTFGGLVVDLAACPEVATRAFWSADRVHPSEYGHRAVARRWAGQLMAAGLDVVPPSAQCDRRPVPSWRTDLAWLRDGGAVWWGKQARLLGPGAVRLAWDGLRAGWERGLADREQGPPALARATP